MGNVLTTGIDYMKEPLSDSRRVTAKSILKLTPKKEHHNTTFTCQAQNTADRTYRSAKLKLEVSTLLLSSVCFFFPSCEVERVFTYNGIGSNFIHSGFFFHWAINFCIQMIDIIWSEFMKTKYWINILTLISIKLQMKTFVELGQ